MSLCTLTSMPFSKRLSGSDFISQRQDWGDSELSLFFPDSTGAAAFLFPPAVSPSSTLPVVAVIIGPQKVLNQTRSFTLRLYLLTWTHSSFTRAGPRLWRHLSRSMTTPVKNVQSITGFMISNHLPFILLIRRELILCIDALQNFDSLGCLFLPDNFFPSTISQYSFIHTDGECDPSNKNCKITKITFSTEGLLLRICFTCCINTFDYFLNINCLVY